MPEEIREIRERRDAFAQAALTGLIAATRFDDLPVVRDAQLRRLAAEARELGDLTIAELNRTAIYPAPVTNTGDETAIDNARHR
jgi:hypothetical protein